jgi:hypothetical protein
MAAFQRLNLPELRANHLAKNTHIQRLKPARPRIVEAPKKSPHLRDTPREKGYKLRKE